MRLTRSALAFLPLLILSFALPSKSSVGFQASGDAQLVNHVRQEIIEREKASFAAWRNQDKAFYADYWADDMTEFLPDNPKLLRKEENMKKFEQFVRDWRLDGIDMINPEVRLYGEVAVLTYRENVSGKYKGKALRYSGKVTMIYVKHGVTWKGVHYHESKD